MERLVGRDVSRSALFILDITCVKTNVLSLEEEGRGRGGKIDNYTLTAIERVVIAGCSPFITVNS